MWEWRERHPKSGKPTLREEGLKDILSDGIVLVQRFHCALIFWREGGGDSCPLRRGKERRSLFNFRQSYVWSISRESQTITLLLLHIVFSSCSFHKYKTYKLGKVILVVPFLPPLCCSSSFSNSSLASAIISSTSLQHSTWVYIYQ